MISTSETGHAKNIANFQRLIEFVTDYGTAYNPSKASLKLPELLTLKTESDSALLDVIDKNTVYNNSVNQRVSAFADIKPLATRLVNALQTTEAGAETIKDAKGFNRKIQGKRTAAPQTPTDPNEPVPNTISSSQLSYDQLIQHFTGLVSVLRYEVSYAPNEVDLKIASLDVVIEDMVEKNAEVARSYTKISSARTVRDQTLYQRQDSLLETALEIKKYIKSVFGTTSPQYEQVKGILIKRAKK